jgi:hypothetical protein
MNLSRYGKFWMSLVGMLATYGSTYYSTNHWVQLVLGLLTAAGVYAVPNAAK